MHISKFKTILGIKNPWYKKPYFIKTGATSDLTSMTESEVYDLLKQTIKSYNSYNQRYNQLIPPTIKPEYCQIYVELIKDACSTDGISHQDWKAYAAERELNTFEVRKACFQLGEYLSSIYEYQESANLLYNNMQEEAKYIKYLQKELGIGI